jgi:peptide/nickel transport system substrate-binding protein
MLSIYTQQVFSIGLINSTLQPIMRSAKLRNIPDKALYGFDPTCYLGVYMPDTFWMGRDA